MERANDKTVRKKLKMRRIELGLTLKDVADKVGVSEATVSRWESGDIANMRRDRILLLADVLQISPSVVMGEEDNFYFFDDVHRIPVYINVPFDDPQLRSEKPLFHEYSVPHYGFAGIGSFALLMPDSSMEPYIHKYDIAFIVRITDFREGIALLYMGSKNAEVRIMQRRNNGMYIFSADCKTLKPHFYDSNEIEEKQIQIIGKVIEVRSSYFFQHTKDKRG